METGVSWQGHLYRVRTVKSAAEQLFRDKSVHVNQKKKKMQSYIKKISVPFGSRGNGINTLKYNPRKHAIPLCHDAVCAYACV
jgi:hypothetical protein